MYKNEFSFNNLQWLMCHEHQLNKINMFDYELGDKSNNAWKTFQNGAFFILKSILAYWIYCRIS